MDNRLLSRTLITMTMTLALTFPLLVWSNHIAEATNSLCAAVCVCENLENNVVKADCSRVYLNIVPPVDDWPRNTTYMDLSSNTITELDTELAHDTVQVLDLSYNHITKLAQNAFGGLKNLRYLNLASNNIKEFDENGFYGQEKLKSLNISGNNIKVLPNQILYFFLGLEELSLADNPLVHIDPIHFNRMINLRWLDLSNTDLYTLPANLFHNTGMLEVLDLSANDFHKVPTDALRSAKKLRHLILNENPLDVLDKTSFIMLSSLETLELNEMSNLEKVAENTFSSLINLKVLEMKYNRRLSNLDPKAFEGLFNGSRPTLQVLDLEGNQLNYMDKDTVPCAKIWKFNVQKNPWFCDCSMRWIKHCEIQRIFAADLKCLYPDKLENAMIYSLTEEDFTCDFQQRAEDSAEAHHHQVVRSISVAVAVGFLVTLALIIALVFKWKSIKSWYRYKSGGPGAVYYVRARNCPGPAVNQS